MEKNLDYFREIGLRLTPLRREIFHIFSHLEVPIRAVDLCEYLSEKGLNPNKTTVYRQLEVFVAEKILQRFLLNGDVSYYERFGGHHHHFFCNGCNRVMCLGNDGEFEKQIHGLEDGLRERGFFPKEHFFSFSGMCPECHTCC